MPRLPNRLAGTAILLLVTGLGLCLYSLLDSVPGVTWSKYKAPDPGTNAVLNAISCPNTHTCWAVGETSTSAFALHGSNGTWTASYLKATAGTVPTLQAVSCWSATGCLAVGSMRLDESYAPLLFKYNGAAWTQVVIPTIGAADVLSDVECHSQLDCLVTGSSTSGGGMGITLPATSFLLSNAGGSWMIIHAAPVPTTYPNASTENYSNLVCPLLDRCMIVDSYISSASSQTILVDGANNWKQYATSGLSTITAAACESETVCWFVGSSKTNGTLAADEFSSGFAQSTSLPDPASPPATSRSNSSPFISLDTYAPSLITSISCVNGKSTCLAVGNCPSQRGTRTLALVLSGSTWTLTQPPAPERSSPHCSPQLDTPIGPAAAHLSKHPSSGIRITYVLPAVTSSSFTAVSCTMENTCWAVGTETGDPSHPLLIAEATLHASVILQPSMVTGIFLLLIASGFILIYLRKRKEES